MKRQSKRGNEDVGEREMFEAEATTSVTLKKGKREKVLL